MNGREERQRKGYRKRVSKRYEDPDAKRTDKAFLWYKSNKEIEKESGQASRSGRDLTRNSFFVDSIISDSRSGCQSDKQIIQFSCSKDRILMQLSVCPSNFHVLNSFSSSQVIHLYLRGRSGWRSVL